MKIKAIIPVLVILLSTEVISAEANAGDSLKRILAKHQPTIGSQEAWHQIQPLTFKLSSRSPIVKLKESIASAAAAKCALIYLPTARQYSRKPIMVSRLGNDRWLGTTKIIDIKVDPEIDDGYFEPANTKADLFSLD